MKQLLIALFIFAGVFQQATAQSSGAVSAAAFNNQITLLKQKINPKVPNAVASILTQLNSMMSQQMAYVKAAITTAYATASQDLNAVTAYGKITAVDSAQVAAVFCKAGQDMHSPAADLQVAQTYINLYKIDSVKQVTATQTVRAQTMVVSSLTGNLNNETSAYNTLQPLIQQAQSNKSVDVNQIVTNLQNFAATLH